MLEAESQNIEEILKQLSWIVDYFDPNVNIECMET